MENKETTTSIHRVGTITCGIILVLYGVLFLLHMILPTMNYQRIFEFWPIILIVLGIEILVGCVKKQKDTPKYVYDFPAILLVMLLAFFAMLMAAVDFGLKQGGIWI
ncbi:MAG: hypothetical protein IJO97_01890 [Lachnospiraceae bacterium]|nr:hypothetical protein [Lachnospiraceae bacterium]